MKLLASLVLLLALGFGGAYYASPYVAVWRLEQAAKALDAGSVSGLVDFPAVKANLSPHLAAVLNARVETERRRPHSLVDQIGMMLAPLLAGRPADAVLTPQAVAVMLKTGAPPAYANPYRQGRDADAAHKGKPFTVSEGYVDHDMDEFQATIGNRLDPERGVKIRLLRRGFFSWRVTSLDLASPHEGAGS